jgi:predicted TIM-barrel fold metal-dependent hydrolase
MKNNLKKSKSDMTTSIQVQLTILCSAMALLFGCGAEKPASESAAIPVIDTHIHLYDTNRSEGVPWPPITDKVLYRPVLSEDFDAICEANEITATVIVEASDRVEDNQWALDLVKHNPGRYLGLVGNLPIGTEAFAGLLNRFAKDKRFVGLRMRQRPGGEHFFTDAVWRDLQMLAEKRLTLDVLMSNFDLADVSLIAERVPTLKILINHLTGLTITGDPVDAEWSAAVKKAAAHANVHCKVSGIFQRSGQSPAPKELSYYAPIFKVIFDAFGEDRIIYGSNWPVTDRGGKYEEQLSIINEFFKPMGRTTLEKLYWKNASKFYGVELVTH